MDMAVLAGSASTAIFVVSALPMLVKAARTRDLDSYSRSQLLLSNVGNAINSVYVFSLPVGPIWFLHAFNLVCTLLMLAWHVRYAGQATQPVDDAHRSAPSMTRSQTGSLTA
jgi:hypothetical protein